MDEVTEEGGVDHINQLAKMYVNADSYYGGFAPAEMADQETRVIFKLKPNRVVPFAVPQ